MLEVRNAMDYLLFQSSYPVDAHRVTLAALEDLDEGATHAQVPSDIVRDHTVRRAVRAMLGSVAEPDVCRHIHLNSGSEPGNWHIDNYCGAPWPDNATFAILCYFPQDTPAEMGPTTIRVDGQEIIGSGPAGTCLLMRQHVEHRATANTTGQRRVMLKYLFRANKP